MSLYKLSQAYREVRDNDDTDPQTIADTLDSIKDPLKDKLDSIAWIIDQLQSDSKTLKDKAKEFNEIARHKQNRADWLKQYLKDSLDLAGIKKMQTDNHVISIRNFKASTIIDDEDAIPEKYRNYAKYQGLFDVDKKAIYRDLKAGKEVPGTHLKPNQRAVIK